MYNTIYSKGYETLSKKIDKFIELNPDWGHEDDYIADEWSTTIKSDDDIFIELENECAEDAFINDGYTAVGQCSPEEVYYLLVEHYGEETANEYLDEIEFFETEAVA